MKTAFFYASKKMAKNELTKIDNEIITARHDLSVVEQGLKLTISNHANYVDKLGKKSSGAKGFALQINIRIKKAFENGRDDMSLDQMLLLKSLLAWIDRFIVESEKNGLTRKKIKEKTYATIEKYGELL